MRVCTPLFLLTAGLASILLAPPLVHAADAPVRQSGLWELQTETTTGGQKMPGPVTLQMCVEQGRDDLMADPRGTQDMRKRCPKMDVKRTGNKVTIDSVCMMDGHTASGRTLITGNLATDYRMENTTRFDPPLHGLQTLSSTVTGKWLGACKPGQKHGSVTLTGIPRGPGGELRMDPEMVRRMQQMQQPIGR